MLTTVAVLFESPEPLPRVGVTALGLIAVTGVLQPARSVALILAIVAAAGQVALGLGNGLPLAPATLLGGAGTVLVGILADELGKAHRQQRCARDEMLRA